MKSLEENELGNSLEVPCKYRFVAMWRLIKLEGLLQNQVTASQFFVNLIKLPFTITKDLMENPEFNKHCSH